MPKFIVKHRDHYAEWSTVVDAPVTNFMSLPEMEKHVAFRYGQEGLDALPPRIKRADETGSSSLYGDTWESCVQFNRAGPGETRLDADGLWDRYGPKEERS